MVKLFFVVGGVHVIMTFLPDDDSENKQIEGRTCRQDNPGSARKILFAEDLKHEYAIKHVKFVFTVSLRFPDQRKSYQG